MPLMSYAVDLSDKKEEALVHLIIRGILLLCYSPHPSPSDGR